MTTLRLTNTADLGPSLVGVLRRGFGELETPEGGLLSVEVHDRLLHQLTEELLERGYHETLAKLNAFQLLFTFSHPEKNAQDLGAVVEQIIANGQDQYDDALHKLPLPTLVRQAVAFLPTTDDVDVFILEVLETIGRMIVRLGGSQKKAKKTVKVCKKNLKTRWLQHDNPAYLRLLPAEDRYIELAGMEVVAQLNEVDQLLRRRV